MANLDLPDKVECRPEFEGNVKNVKLFFFIRKKKNLISLRICATEFGLVAMHEQ